MESPTPITPFKVGRSRPRIAPSNNPQTGAVAKIRPVLPALERLTPNVKPVWAVATPQQPSAAMGSMSPLRSLLLGSRSCRTNSSNRPPTVNRRATSNIGEIVAVAYLVAAKFRPQKVAARTSETSVANAALSFRSNTGADCTVSAMNGWPAPDLIYPPTESFETGPYSSLSVREASRGVISPVALVNFRLRINI
jgi:hypothetical protein